MNTVITYNPARAFILLNGKRTEVIVVRTEITNAGLVAHVRPLDLEMTFPVRAEDIEVEA